MIKAQSRQALGTNAQVLKDVLGSKPKIGLLPSNLAGTKRVLLKLQDTDGNLYDAICSPRVSAGLRDKSITLSMLLNFTVSEIKLTSGEVINSIQMPTEGVQWTAELQPATYVAPAIDLSDLIAW